MEIAGSLINRIDLLKTLFFEQIRELNCALCPLNDIKK